ncbi:MAG: helix-turn-helix transcriptional regulator [Bacteroidia bacterium]
MFSVAVRHLLSPAEIKGLEYKMNNLYSKEAAAKQHISVHTYNTQVKCAYAKLRVHSKTHAVEKLTAFN